jgi:hypothetical protein
MAKLEINIGVEGNDGTGDSIRESFRKVNANFNELYAVFGIGGQIGFTDLGDTPDTYEGNENKIPVVRDNATGLSFLELASDNALGEGVDTIGFDFSQEGKLAIKLLTTKLELDPRPQLNSPLNAAFNPIARVEVSQQAVDQFNSLYQSSQITIGDLVIDKKYADRNYQQRTVAGGGIRIGDEPDSIDQYRVSTFFKTTETVTNGNLIINNHGLTERSNGETVTYSATIIDPSSPATSGAAYFIRVLDANTISLHTTKNGAEINEDKLQLTSGFGVVTIRSVLSTFQGNLLFLNHGLTEAFNGAEFMFESTETDPSNVVSGDKYFVRVVDEDRISLHSSDQDAVNNVNRILLSGGAGIFSLLDAAFNSSLPGNWLSNVALPRKSIVRRQGDNMEGPLKLHDHPGSLSGLDRVRSEDDLQAVTKLYADSFDTTSQINLYVRTSGNDHQPATPFGLEGRNPAYAFKTINAACQKAEELIIASPIEPGPYIQTIKFNQGQGLSTLTAGSFVPVPQVPENRINTKILIEKNKQFVSRETVEYVRSQFPEVDFDEQTLSNDIERILGSVSLDAMSGNNANYLSRYAGLRYYSDLSARRAIGEHRALTLTAIEYARSLVINFILENRVVGTELGSTLFQNRVSQFIDSSLDIDTGASGVINNKFFVVTEVIENGVLSAPRVVDGPSNYRIDFSNGGFGFVDQGSPLNTDIITGKVVRGQSSGAIGRIISYQRSAGSSFDRIELQLLEPTEFQVGENLEYGNFVSSTQVTVHVESGIHEEDYPIRVPANTSINGDEFRRVIIRPKKRVSQSRYADLFFYRDAEFDGLVLGKSSIEQISVVNPSNPTISDGVYIVFAQDYVTNKLGKGADFEITVEFGTVISVDIVNPGRDFQKDELITIPGEFFGPSSSQLVLKVDKVPNGIEYINPLTNQVDAYFGNHYLNNPERLRDTGAGYLNVGWKKASLILLDNQNFITEQVINFIETQDSSVVQEPQKSIVEDEVKSVIVSLSKDLSLGRNEFSLERQGLIKNNKNQETLDLLEIGLDHIFTISQKHINRAGSK